MRHVYFHMEELKAVRRWFVCVGLNLKDAFLYVPFRYSVKKFLRFAWKGKLYDWLVLPFSLKFFLRILTFLVNPIFCFFHCRYIRMTAYMDNFTNQGRCQYKAIFEIYVIALVFICYGWWINISWLRHLFIWHSFWRHHWLNLGLRTNAIDLFIWTTIQYNR